MQNHKRAGTVIFVSNRSPDTIVAEDIEAHGLVMKWARSIRAAVDLLTGARQDRDRHRARLGRWQLERSRGTSQMH